MLPRMKSENVYYFLIVFLFKYAGTYISFYFASEQIIYNND